MYRVQYFYETGDSFSLMEKQAVLEYRWKNRDVAEENVRRIWEHYRWYESLEEYRHLDPVPRPEWHEKEVESDVEHGCHWLLTLKADDGSLYKFSAPWCGYFEHLFSVEVVEDEDVEEYEYMLESID